jgi:hypothetical protein
VEQTLLYIIVSNQINQKQMTKFIKTIVSVLAIVIAACSPMGVDTNIIQPLSLNTASSNTIDPIVLNPSTNSQTQTVVVGTGGNEYTVTSNVSWYGSTTTWTYTITATSDAKDISHISFLGIDGCFLSDWMNATQNPLTLTQEGNTGCVPDMTTEVYKSTDDANDRTKTFTFTFGRALAVDTEAATLLVKAGSVQSGAGCASVMIPGPSCTELTISGKVEKKVCNETQTEVVVAEGVTVTAQQGSQTLTATTGVDGVYSFPNVGGEWAVSVDGADAQLVTAGPDNGSADFLFDARSNGSCAVIVGTTKIIDCFEQSMRTNPYIGITASCEHSSCTTLSPDGSFRFANSPVGTHIVTVDGVTTSVVVASENGTYDAGEIVVDKTDGGVCGDTEVVCSLSQGYWFAKPNAVWSDGSVTIGGKTYTQAEGKAIWNTSNSKGLLNAKAAFTQAAAIKLSNVSPSASVWADVQIIEAYFTNINKLTPTTIPGNTKTGPNALAGAAAGRIGNWISNNHCNE